MPTEPRYSIGVVSRITGLPADTIRVWERRYRLVEPARNSSGIRLYSESDIARLEHARMGVESGHSISLIARMPNEVIRDLVSRDQDEESPRSLTASAAARTVDDVLDAVERYDITRAEALLKAAALLLDPLEIVSDVLGPIMRTIGDRWESRRFSIAQEHLASQLVRNLIANIARLTAVTKSRTMLFATPPGESHEFGLLFAACLASVAGVQTYVLGSQVPAPEVTRAARRTSASVIVIAALRQPEELQVDAYCMALSSKLAPGCELWLGGHRSGRALLRGTAGTTFIPSLKEFARRTRALK